MISTSQLTVLIFDMDDTLVVEKASAEAAFLTTCELARARYAVEPRELHASIREACRRLWHAAPVRPYCVEIGISSWEALWARFDGEGEHLRFLREWAPQYRRDSWHEALARHGINDVGFALTLAETFPLHRRGLHLVYDDVRPALEHLRRSFRLGLLTNGAADLQHEKLAGSGIADYFDEVVISGDIGFGKPDPRVFAVALARLGVAADEALMIGNDLETDVQGAQAAGMQAVWVNRTASPREGGIAPDAEVSNLTELVRLLRDDAAVP